MNFWDYEVWSFLFLLAVLLITLLVGNIIRRKTPFLRDSLIPTSVLGGIILIIVTSIYWAIVGETLFDTSAFNFNGTETLEIITYHCLALGFIASTLKTTDKQLTKERSVEVFNTGVTTVATYLLQGVVGLGLTIIFSLIVTSFFPAAMPKPRAATTRCALRARAFILPARQRRTAWKRNAGYSVSRTGL